MIKKKILIIFFFLTSCGYQPILNLKNTNYSIADYELSGDREINKILRKNFNKYSNKANKTKQFELIADSQLILTTNSKNESGKNSNLSLEILINLEILVNGKILKKTNYKENTNYNSLDNKFELKQYEKILIKELTNRIVNRIHSNLSLTE